jgi:phosphopantetheinyl transferase (holo-ACP synthase)
MDDLRRFAGREVFLSILLDGEKALSDDRDAVKKRLFELRDRLAEHPGLLGGKPEVGKRLFAPPGGLSAARMHQWILSRSCLIEVLSQMFDRMEAFGPGASVLLSLTHTRGFAGVVGMVARPEDKPHLVGLGFDAEPVRRRVSAEIMRRIAAPEDHSPGLDRITVWTAKEACLKADPQPGSALSGYVLKSYAAAFDKGVVQALGDRNDFRVLVDRIGDFRVAIALGYSSHPLAVVQQEAAERGFPPQG